jgi:predicted dehydrogenase
MTSPRREFLKLSAASAAAVTVVSRTTESLAAPVIPVSPAEPIRPAVTLAVIGCGGMGMNHLRTLSGNADVRVATVCDVDAQRLEDAKKVVAESSGLAPHATSDMRAVFADPRIEAVLIATPDHWHSPAAIQALRAGKHVYVEKPCSHNVREGRLLCEAVRETGRVLQVGTQSRSTDCVRDGIERVLSGAIGEVLVAKAWNSQRRSSIGRSEPAAPPANLDFDAWMGPALETAYRPNLLHGVWRWWYDFGCGDIGNDGVHDIDVALWGLGVETHPSRVSCFGGKSFFDDDQQFPDTQYAVCEYPISGVPAGRCKQLIFEQRIWSPYVQEGYENGAAFYGTEGVLIMGHSVGWKLVGPRGKLLAERTSGGDLAAHHRNFLAAIRDPAISTNATAVIGHRAATIVHLCNIAARTGSVLRFDPDREVITNDAAAQALLSREYRADHWAVPAGV